MQPDGEKGDESPRVRRWLSGRSPARDHRPRGATKVDDVIKGSAFKQGCTEGDIEHALDNTMFWYDMGDFDMCIGPIPAGELLEVGVNRDGDVFHACLLYTSPSPRDS